MANPLKALTNSKYYLVLKKRFQTTLILHSLNIQIIAHLKLEISTNTTQISSLQLVLIPNQICFNGSIIFLEYITIKNFYLVKEGAIRTKNTIGSQTTIPITGTDVEGLKHNHYSSFQY